MNREWATVSGGMDFARQRSLPLDPFQFPPRRAGRRPAMAALAVSLSSSSPPAAATKAKAVSPSSPPPVLAGVPAAAAPGRCGCHYVYGDRARRR